MALNRQLRLTMIHDEHNADSRALLESMQASGPEEIQVVSVEEARGMFPLRAAPAVAFLIWADSLEELGEWQAIARQLRYFKSEDDMRALFGKAADIAKLTDDEVEQAADTLLEVSEWMADMQAEAGQWVRYDGMLWQCVQSHATQTNWQPGTAATLSLWRRIFVQQEGESGVQPWVALEDVRVGDLRSYMGVTYRCLQGHSTLPNWTPDISPSMWVAVE